VAQDGSQDSAPEDEVITVRVSTETVVVPDFRGMGKRKVVNRCQELGIRVQPSGSGIAVSQIPPAGAEIPVGEICSVVFARGFPESNKIPAAVGALRVAPDPQSIPISIRP
jgi:beta-lactam-binding protein with PASTA domain